jgi:hypothetical protein
MRSATNMWTTGTLAVLFLLTMACASTPSTPPPTTGAPPGPETPTTTAGPAWAKEGATFTGPPAGGRGGSYRYTLCPGGTYMRWCLDADCDRGTWRVDADAVVLVSENPDTKGQETRLQVSADGKTLGPADIEGGPLTHSGPPENCGG